MRRLVLLSSLVACSTIFVGCTDDSSTTDSTTTVEVGPPSLELISPADGTCFSIGDDPNARIPFVVKTSALYLRAPGICGEAVQCGQLRLSANGNVVQRSTASVIEWEIGMVDVADRYGTFTMEIAAVTDSDVVLIDRESKPLVVTTTITAAAQCAGSGGAGGSGGTGGTGGSGGSGGAGGSGGSGGAGGGT